MRGFITLEEELGRETWTLFLGCRKVLLVVVESVEADSGCFPFDFDEIGVKFGDVGCPFAYQANNISTRSERKEGGYIINSPAIQTWGYHCTA